jgi:glycosyltransferase involved in cell wall biosynthesis
VDIVNLINNIIRGPYDFSHWNEIPSISACCITYGRPELLEEAIECFLRQDYPGQTDMVILNDHEEIKIEWPDAPDNIQIINLDERVPTIGEKRNISVDLSKGQLCCPWDDDDLCLPWRFAVSVQEMRNHHYYKPNRSWYWGVLGHCEAVHSKIYLKPRRNVFHSQGMWSREAYEEIGKYKPEQSGQDITFEKDIAKYGYRDEHSLKLKDLYYVYRYGKTGSFHLSQWGRNNGYDEAPIWIKKYSKVKPGTYKLNPHWDDNYVEWVDKNLYDVLNK